MNAIVEHADFVEVERPLLLTPARQAAFLQSLAEFGNVRLAVRAAGVSPQTAYRQRRREPAFAEAWDAALVSARHVAEEVLADRAINGVEEAVYYHGEEVATRRRYDARLLLAHLARLDKLAERADVAAALSQLDDAIDALRDGTPLPEVAVPEGAGAGAHTGAHTGARTGAGNYSQDSVPCVPPRPVPPGADPAWATSDGLPDDRFPDGSWYRRIPPDGYCEWIPDMDDPEHWDAGRYIPPVSRILNAMEAARPRRAKAPHEFTGWNLDDVEAEQMAAFEAGVEEWWRVVPPGPGDPDDEWVFAAPDGE
ncbi:hypothetical protein [Tsuneonella mangrovi]|uniref:hypothetical protein n=1 Tax=Tsuneonella mangrovi TaxID=1982042 RepID=UPI000BA27835|nr:hypothetical protein [Tsuneonella mangrovi]